MKDILEYSKQAPNDYPFVYQDTMERMFSEDLNGALEDYEDKLLQGVSKLKDDYDLLRDDKRYRTPSSYVRFYEQDSSKIKDLLFDSLSYAYQTGGQQAYKDFNQDKSFDLGLSELLEISKFTESKIVNITESYRNLVMSKLRVAINSGSSYEDFYSDLSSYRGFKKRADESYTPPMPNRKVLVDNYSTREVSRGVNNGRMAGYARTKRIISYIYKTRADERVSTKCSPWHNQEVPANQATGLIPQHRNCRCTLVPYL